MLSKGMNEACSNIYLLFNIWTFSNSIAFMAIIAHYIDNNLKYQITLITLHWVISSDIGKVVAKQVV